MEAQSCATGSDPGTTTANPADLHEENVVIRSGCDAAGENCVFCSTGQVQVFDESDALGCAGYEQCSNCTLVEGDSCD
jgi:hypothetical protein